MVIVQNNIHTSKIQINDRFLFNNIGFKVKQIFNELNPNYLELYMMKAPELEGDNFKENIAINEEPVIETKLNGNVLLPEDKEILQGDIAIFNIYNYVNGVKQADTFTINANNVPKKNYNINIIDGNNFSIENLIEYQINPLEIECINDLTGDKTIKQLWLGGNW